MNSNNLPSVFQVRTEEKPHITKEQYQQVLTAIGTEPNPNRNLSQFKKDRNKLYVKMLWHTGGRNNDILDIKVSDINTTTKILDLRVHKVWHVKRKLKNGEWKAGQDFKKVQIKLKDALIVDILNYLNQYNKHMPGDYLFTNSKGKRITKTQGYLVIKHYGNLINLPNLHPHMFRHGLAIYLMQQGIPTQIISARLGHTNVFTTINTYQVITPDVQESALRNVEFD